MKVQKGQHKRTPEEAAELQNACVRAIADNLEVKAIAADLQIRQTYVYTILRRMGYEKVIVSPDERWAVHQMRAGKGKFVEGKV